MIVAVTGGRDFVDVPFIWLCMDARHKQYGITLLIDGASDDVTGPYIGADYWCNQWARSRRINFERIPANWAKYGKRAGPIRNQEILKSFSPRVLIAFPGGRGTADMIRRAIAAGVLVDDAGELWQKAG